MFIAVKYELQQENSNQAATVLIMFDVMILNWL